jgi:hypothetical protein
MKHNRTLSGRRALSNAVARYGSALLLVSTLVFSASAQTLSATPCCAGDCDGDERVLVTDLMVLVDIALDGFTPDRSCACLPACFDLDSSCPVIVPGLIEAVNNAMSGCPSRRDAPNQLPFELFSLDEPCGDQTGAAILADVSPEYHVTLRPLPYGELPTEVPLTLRLGYQGGRLVCYPAVVPPSGSTRPVVLEQVGIVVAMQLKTEDGAFDEQFQAEIKGRNGYVSFEYGTEPENLRGTYRPNLPGYQDVEVGFWGNLAKNETNGGIDESGAPPGHVSEITFVAQWATWFDQGQ